MILSKRFASALPAFDPSTNQLFVVNAQSGAVAVMTLDASGAPTYSTTLSAEGRAAADASTVVEGAVVNSVSVARGVLAVAVQHADKVQHGWTLFFRTSDLGYLGGVRVGSQPDGLKFSANGKHVVVAPMWRCLRATRRPATSPATSSPRDGLRHHGSHRSDVRHLRQQPRFQRGVRGPA